MKKWGLIISDTTREICKIGCLAVNLPQENRDGSFDVITQEVVKKHLTTQSCFNTLVINELCFLAWACIDEEAKNHNALPMYVGRSRLR